MKQIEEDTTSASTGNTGPGAIMMPFKQVLKRAEPGKIYKTSDLISKKKKKKLGEGVFELFRAGVTVMVEAKREKKSVVQGKKGVWRTIRGRHYFFPDDKSGIIPPLHKVDGGTI